MANVTSLNVNGKKRRIDVDSQTHLLQVLRAVAARETLISLAAEQWKVEALPCAS